ncbi:SdrD B-like domain-containing protein [Streptomyces cuspidosporus]
MGATTGTATAATGDGTLTVQVLRDFFGTGILNTTMDVPQRGMKVAVSDSEGHRVTGTTDATGKVVVEPSTELTGGQYRVDVTIPAPYNKYLQAAPASTAENHFDSFTTFVNVSDGKDDSVITGVWNPADYALPDTRYFVPIQNASTGKDTRALVAFGTDKRGTCPGQTECPTALNTQAQVGTTFALAYDKHRKRLFQGAFARRYTPYGPEGGNAIYTVPADGGETTLFAKVPGAAVTPHDASNMIKDAGFTNAPGKESIGGLALSEDGSTLYAVNLLTRRLVSFDATGTTASAPKATVRIPDPGCAVSADWRPFALSAHDNKLYVGGVCSAESTQKRDDLKAVVYAYDGDRFDTVLTQPLTAERGTVYGGTEGNDQATHWNPWNTDLATWDKFRVNGGNLLVNPQPELSTLAFARDGSMILGFRDRFMDVVSGGGLDPRPGNDTAEVGMSGGDINMACANPTGGYSWEGTGDCPNHAEPATDGGQKSGVVEYFPGDYVRNRANPEQIQGVHNEAAQGAVAYIPQQQWVISTQMDPTDNYGTDGTGYYNIETGQGPGNNHSANAYQFVDSTDNGFGKAGGLGDIAYEAANAPIQIGNRVWFDGDHNGIQDPEGVNEVPLPDATVNLLDSTGKQVATTKTDAAGEYYFGGVGAAYELKPGAKYTVQFNVCTADTSDVPTQPTADELRFTLPRAGANRAHDSNVTPPRTGRLCNGYAPVTAPEKPGGVDHTIDAGVYIVKKTPTPTPTPTPPSSEPPTHQPPTHEPPNQPGPQGGSDQTGGGGGSLANTGTQVLTIVSLSALLVGAGAAVAFAARKRRARQH